MRTSFAVLCALGLAGTNAIKLNSGYDRENHERPEHTEEEEAEVRACVKQAIVDSGVEVLEGEKPEFTEELREIIRAQCSLGGGIDSILAREEEEHKKKPELTEEQKECIKTEVSALGYEKVKDEKPELTDAEKEAIAVACDLPEKQEKPAELAREDEERDGEKQKPDGKKKGKLSDAQKECIKSEVDALDYEKVEDEKPELTDAEKEAIRVACDLPEKQEKPAELAREDEERDGEKQKPDGQKKGKISDAQKECIKTEVDALGYEKVEGEKPKLTDAEKKAIRVACELPERQEKPAKLARRNQGLARRF